MIHEAHDDAMDTMRIPTRFLRGHRAIVLFVVGSRRRVQENYSSYRLNSSAPFVPPNPNEFDSA
jgi:hypothetical protein